MKKSKIDLQITAYYQLVFSSMAGVQSLTSTTTIFLSHRSQAPPLHSPKRVGHLNTIRIVSEYQSQFHELVSLAAGVDALLEFINDLKTSVKDSTHCDIFSIANVFRVWTCSSIFSSYLASIHLLRI